MANLLYFGRVSDVGVDGPVDIPSGLKTVRDLRRWLCEGDPGLGAVLRETTIKAIVNGDIAADDTRVSNTDEIAFFSPMSGG